MYAKLFASIYQGTLRGDTHGLVVFTNLLAHADSQGWADIHPKAIAEETGLTLDQVQAALTSLEAPDPESRSPEENGRRIKRLDEHRAWGWQIVNHAKYRAIRSEEDRRAQNRAAQERYRAKQAARALSDDSKQSKPRKPPSAQAEAEAEAEAEKTTTSRGTSTEKHGSSKAPACPYDAIVAAYHTALPTLNEVVALNDARRAHIQARWREAWADAKFDTQGGIDFFARYFAKVSRSKFLTGHGKPREPGGKPFKADLDWLIAPTNFLKVIEGKYE